MQWFQRELLPFAHRAFQTDAPFSPQYRRELKNPQVGIKGSGSNILMQIFNSAPFYSRRFAERLSATGMHKMTHLIYGVLRTGRLFDPNYLTNGLAVQDSISLCPGGWRVELG
jgi:hypothetical protein